MHADDTAVSRDHSEDDSHMVHAIFQRGHMAEAGINFR